MNYVTVKLWGSDHENKEIKTLMINDEYGTLQAKYGTEEPHEFNVTGGWTSFVYEDIAVFDLKSGENTLIISDKTIPNTYLINIREIVLEKAD